MSTDQDKLIAELVEKGLTGDMEPINSIEDRVLRAKVKSALIKARRTGLIPEVPKDLPQPETEEVVLKQTVESEATSDNPDAIVEQAVQAALDGNMDVIKKIEDLFLRAKAKSALVKAKRENT